MKVTGKIGWVSLNNVSKKLFEFDSNVFHCFKDHFLKVMATDVVADGIMGDFPLRPLVKQVGPISGVVPPFIVPPTVGLVVIVDEVSPSALSSILANRKQDDGVGPSGRKKSRAPMSLCILRQVVGLKPGAGHPLSLQDAPTAPTVIETPASATIVATIPAPLPPPAIVVQEVTPTTRVGVPTTSASSVLVSSSTAATPLLSVGVATTSAPIMSPPPSLAPPDSTFCCVGGCAAFLVFFPDVSLDHMYTSSNVNSLWGGNYKPEQKTSTGIVSTFDKNLIWSVGVQNATNFAKVFLQRSLTILEENEQRHREALCKVSSLEIEVAKWRANAHMVWRQKRPKLANATIAFAEVVRSNH
ncbi:hypothetical protein JHK85_016346 [Glycine max]|nr:hypothetical protein JHK85_016346 [Glycine max]KAG5046568.1 hypothetical protein JHK86_015974 [Glycine max]